MIKGKPQNRKLKKAERKKIAAYDYLHGRTQREIAAKLDVSISTVSRDLAELGKEWLKDAIEDTAIMRELELKRLDEVYADASKMYEDTHEPRWLEIKLKVHERRSKYLGLDHADQRGDDGLDKLAALAESFLKT